MQSPVTIRHRVRCTLGLWPGLLLPIVVLAAAVPTSAQNSSPIAFEAILTGTNEAPAVHTGALGQVTALLNGTQLHLTGSFADLSADYTAAHIHLGAIGENGDPVFSLTPTLDESNRRGTFNQTVTLSEGQVDVLRNAAFYVNVHSAAHEDGEIRGQLLPSATRVFRAQLAVGTGPRILAVLNGNELRLTGTFNDLPSAYISSSLHVGAEPERAPVVQLNANPDADPRSGTFLSQRNIIRLSDALVEDLVDGRLWMRIYLADQTENDLAGQIQPAHDDLTVYETVLSGANEVPTVNTVASGRVTLLLGVANNPNSTRIVHLFGSFNDLSSTVSGAHIHLGAIGEHGGPVVTLPTVPDPNPQYGTIIRLTDAELSPELVQALQEQRLYINVHSTMYEGGEIRGQLLPVQTQVIRTSLTGEAAVPPVTTDAAGWAAVLVNGNEVRLTGAFSDLSGDFSNAYLHVGEPTETTPSFFTLQPVMTDDQRSGVFLTSAENSLMLSDAQVAALDAGRLYLNVNSTEHASGEIRGHFNPAAPVGVEDGEPLPKAFALAGNYPNPFNPSTRIVFDLPAAAHVSVEVFDLLGRRVLALPPQAMEAGPARTLRLDAGALPSGMYLYRVVMRQGATVQAATGRMVLVK